MVILFNKPFGVLCQFSGEGKTLADFIKTKNIYPAGRLDKDSEGLLILTDDGLLQHKLSHPKYDKVKTYFVQVEQIITLDALEKLRHGVNLKDGLTKPAQAEFALEPDWLWARTPPIRERKNIPTSWLKLSLSEGKNRQVRRMCASVGFHVLRLIRYSVHNHNIDALASGEYKQAVC